MWRVAAAGLALIGAVAWAASPRLRFTGEDDMRLLHPFALFRDRTPPIAPPRSRVLRARVIDAFEREHRLLEPSFKCDAEKRARPPRRPRVFAGEGAHDYQLLPP